MRHPLYRTVPVTRQDLDRQATRLERLDRVGRVRSQTVREPKPDLCLALKTEPDFRLTGTAGRGTHERRPTQARATTVDQTFNPKARMFGDSGGQRACSGRPGHGARHRVTGRPGQWSSHVDDGR